MIQSHKSAIFSKFDRPLVFGHRGVPEEHQENTLPGFKRAIELGIDGVELDVLMTKDNKLVVLHDMDLKRLTGFSGCVPDLTWDQIKTLEIQQCIDVGDKTIDYGKKEKIVLLEDALEEMRGKLIVDIEIKACNGVLRQRRTSREVAKLILEMELLNNTFVTSFSFSALFWFKQAYSEIESGLVHEPSLSLKDNLQQRLIASNLASKIISSSITAMSINMINDDSIERIHDKGFAIGVWTAFPQNSEWLGASHSEEQQLRYIKDFTERGIDYFITDEPVKLQTILNDLPGV